MREDFSIQFATLLTQANEDVKGAGEMLNTAIEGMFAGSFRQNYIIQQALSVASVALDVYLLVDRGRYYNVVGLCRIAFESRVSIYAAMRIPEFVAQKSLATAKGNVEELEELVKTGATDPIFQSELERHKRLLNEMRWDFVGIQEKTWWKFEHVAKAADLMSDYLERYSFLSKATHNTPTGLAAKTDHRILTESLLNLELDTIETCAALVFFQIPGEKSPRPLTTKWEELADEIPAFQDKYGNLRKKFNDLINETFRHPEN
jgi:uncharacterized protein DUF5677